MKPSWNRAGLVVATLLFVSCREHKATNAFSLEPEPTDFQVHYIDTGTSDVVWIHTADDGIPNNGIREGFNILIDSGGLADAKNKSGYELVSAYLHDSGRLPKGSTVDWLVLTHHHEDHASGIEQIRRDYEVRRFLEPGGSWFRSTSSRILDWGRELEVEITSDGLEEFIIEDGEEIEPKQTAALIVSFSKQRERASFYFHANLGQDREELLPFFHSTQFPERFFTPAVVHVCSHDLENALSEDFLNEIVPRHVILPTGKHRGTLRNGFLRELVARIQWASRKEGNEVTVWRDERRGFHQPQNLVAWVKVKKERASENSTQDRHVTDLYFSSAEETLRSKVGPPTDPCPEPWTPGWISYFESEKEKELPNPPAIVQESRTGFPGVEHVEVTFRNDGDRTLAYRGYGEGSGQMYFLEQQDDDWVPVDFFWCGTGMRWTELSPGSEVTISAAFRHAYRKERLYVPFRDSKSGEGAMVLMASEE